MNKEEIIKMMSEKGYELDYDIIKYDGNISISIDEERMWFKPIQKFPIVFKDNFYKINVFENGVIQIGRAGNRFDETLLQFADSIPLLEQALAKSKALREQNSLASQKQNISE